MSLLSFAGLLDLLNHDDHVAICTSHQGVFSSQVVTAKHARIYQVPTDRDVWFSVNPVKGPARMAAGRGSADDVLRLAAIYADLDVKPGGLRDFQTAWDVIEGLSIVLRTRPSAVTLSGNGLQPYWPLEDPPAGDEAMVLLRRWGRLVRHIANRHGGAVDSVYDLARILRVPRSRNHKGEPKEVICMSDPAGRPVTIEEVREACDQCGVLEMEEDRQQIGEIVAPVAGWSYGDQTCHYVQSWAEHWATDTPPARHPWLINNATRLAAAYRAGCLTSIDHAAIKAQLRQRFTELLSLPPARKEGPGEVDDAFAYGQMLVASKTDEGVERELGGHSHFDDTDHGFEGISSAGPKALTPDEAVDEHTSWWPQPIAERVKESAEAPAPTQLRREDGHCLFYPARVNGIIGESESGKSWIALLTVTQAIKKGQRVLILDFEDSADSIYRRLQLLGMRADLEALVHYADPDEALEMAQRKDLAEAFEGAYGLIVVDGVNAAMTLMHYDLNSNTDATLFATWLMRPLARSGACVVMIDHVPKNPDNRNKGGIGAQAKRAMITGCQLTADVGDPFGKGQNGSIKLFVDKDKNGSVRGISSNGKYAGKAVVESATGSMHINIVGPDLQPSDSDTAEAASNWEPTIVMEKISGLLEGLTEPCSFRAIKQAITGKDDTIRKAIDMLHRRGFIEISSGSRNSLLHRSLRPYRASEATAIFIDSSLSEASVSHRVPTVSRVSPGYSEETVSPCPHPSPSFGGGDTGDSHEVLAAVHPLTVSPDTLSLVPDGYSHCNQCGLLAAEAEIELGEGVCLQCRGRD